jgi:murein L,D-transpeptidase YcbB/YkuD
MINRMGLYIKTVLIICGFACLNVHALEPDVMPNTTETPTVVSPVAPAATPATTSEAATVNSNYTRLSAMLPLYERALTSPWPILPDTDRLLHRGITSDVIVLLRERLEATHDLASNVPKTTKFDKTLMEAVKIFQMRNGLKADGVVGEATRNALNVPADVRVKQIRLNMQRWEQLSNDLADRYVLINIPEFKLHLIDNNVEIINMKVIIGKPTRQTPELISHITRIVFNPKWNVPAMIAKNDIVPKVMEDPSYLNTNGIRIFNNDQSDSYEVDSSNVNWEDARENGFPYHFRQDPGTKNALGVVKFEFQNSHDVYMHDTPAKNLFASDVRDFSSGCIRVEKPFALVDFLTRNDPRMDETKIQDTLASRRTTYFRVQQSLPIIITYITAWVDEQGYLHFADDIYHLDDPAQPSDIPQDSEKMSENSSSYQIHDEKYYREHDHYKDHYNTFREYDNYPPMVNPQEG